MTTNTNTKKIGLVRNLRTAGLMGLAALATGCAGWGHFNPNFASTESDRYLAKEDNNARKFLKRAEKSGTGYEVRDGVAYVDAAVYTDFLESAGLKGKVKSYMPFGSIGDGLTIQAEKNGNRETLVDSVLVSPEGTISVLGEPVNALDYTLSGLQEVIKKRLESQGFENVDVNYVNASEEREIPFAGAYGVGFTDGSSLRAPLGKDISVDQFNEKFQLSKDAARFGIYIPAKSKADGKEFDGIVVYGDFSELKTNPGYANFFVPHNAEVQALPAPDAVGDFFHVLRTMTGLGKDAISASQTYRAGVNEFDLITGPQENWRAKKNPVSGW